MTYKYIAYDSGKKVVEGRVDVATETLAEDALYRAGFQSIIHLEEVKAGVSLEKLIPSFFGIKSRDIIDTTNQIATLIKSGITISASLKLLENQTSRKPLKKLLHGLAEEIQGGTSLSIALTHYPQTFSSTYCYIIKASEQAGTLETGLRQAAAYMEKSDHAKQRVSRAAAYPAFVIIMAIAVSILLMTVAMPPLTRLFNSLGAHLPWMTRTLVSVTTFLLHDGVYLLAGLAALAVIFWALLKLPSFRLLLDKFMLKTPLIGPIILERCMEFFCQTASMLLQAGLRLPQIMEIVIQSNCNRVIRRSFESVRARLVQGEGLSQSMSEDKLFPPMLAEMAVVGEKTGEMDTTLATLAEFYQHKVDRRIDVLISMIEPTLTVIVGGVVIFIALSMITPLYSVLRSMPR